MKTNDHIFSSRPPVKAARILFNNLKDVGFANGEQWRKARKLTVSQLLGPKMKQLFHHIREEEVVTLLADISETKVVIDMSDLLGSFMMNLMCKALIGDYPREGLTNKMLHELVAENSCLLEKFYVGDYFPFLGWLDELSGLGARTRRVAKRWDDFIDQVIEHHRLKDENGIANTDSNFINALLSLQKDGGLDTTFTRDHIKVLVHELLFGGVDTTLAALEWGMAELVQNSEAMEKLKDEVRKTARGEERVREEHLSQMRYLKAVIKECLRLHPSGPLLIPRESTQTCQVYGYEVPIKTKVIINAWSIGRDASIWEMPEKFQPERFLDSPIDFRGQDFELIPFGAGRRICPGLQSAALNLELVLANLIHGFDWQLPDGMNAGDLNMDEAPGLTIRKRERLLLVARKVSY